MKQMKFEIQRYSFVEHSHFAHINAEPFQPFPLCEQTLNDRKNL